MGAKLAAELEQLTGNETRLVLPGHIQRGGSPSAYDRVLSTQFGAYAARLIQQNVYGVGVAMVDGVVTHHPLKDIAGKSKLVQPTIHWCFVPKIWALPSGTKPPV